MFDIILLRCCGFQKYLYNVSGNFLLKLEKGKTGNELDSTVSEI